MVIFTLGRHRRRRVLSSAIASGRPLFRPSARPSVCLSVPNDVTALTLQGFQYQPKICLDDAQYHVADRSLFKLALLGQLLRVPRNFEIFQVWGTTLPL